MRIAYFRLRHFRRFVDSEINLDAPVVAIVGPNESGKTSVLEALAQATSTNAVQPRDLNRNHGEPEGPILETTFLLEANEVRALKDQYRAMSDIRWLKVSKHFTGEVSVTSNSPLPHEFESNALARIPSVLAFTDSDRTLKTEYNLQDKKTWNKAVHNLARLAGFTVEELASVASTPQHEELQDLKLRANERLSRTFDASWSQSKLTVSIDILHPAELQIYVKADGGPTLRLHDRSDGLRAFVALVAFLEAKNLRIPPILVVDEAENHLHWDAQADLIDLFHIQDKVSQIIYSTHSPGCLPHDLGHGVRAVIPDQSSPHHSVADNRIWSSSVGFRPLLLRMGASTAALTPHRLAVMTEGEADFILLPSLLREAAGKEALSYQVVPGIAKASIPEIRMVDLESDVVLYVLDGDKGGDGHSKKIRRAGINTSCILRLPNEMTLEDLVVGEVLREAVGEELRRSGHKLQVPLLPDSGRAQFLEEWYAQSNIGAPSKRAIAGRVLEIWSRHRLSQEAHLVEEQHKEALRALDEKLLASFREHANEAVF